MKACILQLYTLGINDSRISQYLSAAKSRGASLVLIGEYIINSFFTDMLTIPTSILREQTHIKRLILEELAKKHELTIVVPMVIFRGDKPFKVVAKFTPNAFESVEQTALINYPHWDEAAFFANKNRDFKFMNFKIDGFKFAVMFGFETHFDKAWIELMKLRPDCVLVPTACTLNSIARWNALLVTRAFTNNVYILRANRLGKAKFEEAESEFYGNSMLVDPNGLIVDSLEGNEGLLICDISKEMLTNAKNMWKFSFF